MSGFGLVDPMYLEIYLRVCNWLEYKLFEYSLVIPQIEMESEHQQAFKEDIWEAPRK